VDDQRRPQAGRHHPAATAPPTHEFLRERDAKNDLAEFDDFGELELCLKKTIARRTCGA
jgi:hypothetical protein